MTIRDFPGPDGLLCFTLGGRSTANPLCEYGDHDESKMGAIEVDAVAASGLAEVGRRGMHMPPRSGAVFQLTNEPIQP